jgi:hypothetical protein
MMRGFPFLTCLLVIGAFAQDPYGHIVGRIADASGASVPAAAIHVTNPDTNVTVTTRSDSLGNYAVRNLIPGQYRVAVEMKGFKRYDQGPIEVRVGDVVTVNVGLTLGALNESVTVSAEAPLLDSASSSVGQVIDRQRLLDLPTPQDNPLYMALLVPGVVSNVSPTANSAWQNNQPEGSSAFTANGAAFHTSEFAIDGIPDMTNYGNADMIPMPEVLQEFRLQTSAYDASSGHYTGARVDMVTKGGTNQLHGAATYQFSGTPLMAVPYFTNAAIYNLATGPVTQSKINLLFPPQRFDRERFVVGGPVWFPKVYDGRNRTFFNFGLDFFKRAFVPTVYANTVPTPAQRNGDFSALLASGSQYQIYDPATIAPSSGGLFSRQPFSGNIIPQNRINPLAQQLLSYYPLPNQPGTGAGTNNYSASPINRPNHHDWFGRLDQVVNANNRLFLDVLHTNEGTVQQAVSHFPSNYFGVHNSGPGIVIILDDVVTLRPDVVLDVRYGFHRLRLYLFPNSLGYDLSPFGVSSSLIAQRGSTLTQMPYLNINGENATPASNTSRDTQDNSHYFIGNVSYIHGSHNLRFGGEFRIYQSNDTNYGYLGPQYTFGTGWTVGPLNNSPAAPIGQGLASFLLGLPTGGSMTTVTTLAQQSTYTAAFIQDDWKLSRKLTLNLGLRYEIETPITERHNHANRGFDFTTPSPIAAAAEANFAPNPVSGVPTFAPVGGILFAGVNGVPRGMTNIDPHIFMPRVGLAYQVAPKTVVRAGFGIFFDSQGGDYYMAPQQGYSQSTSIVPSNNNGLSFQATLTNPFPNGLLQPSGSSLGLATGLGQSVTVFWLDRRPGYAQRWSVNVQHELPNRTLVELGYVGNRAVGLDMSQDFDTVPAQYLSMSPVRDQATINNLTAAVPNPFYSLPQFSGTNLQGTTVSRAQLLLPYPQFTDVSTGSQTLSDFVSPGLSAGYSFYNALEARLEKRLSQGLTLQASYTWSKFMQAISKLNPTDPSPYYVISTMDRPQRVVVSGIYYLPVGRKRRYLANAPRAVDYLVGGWTFGAIYQAESGAPLNWGNIIFTGNLSSIALSGSQRSLTEWFNVNAGFNTVTAQQLANNIRTFPSYLSSVRADGINNWDLALYKGFQLHEKLNFELRAEASDALNHPQFSAPNTTPTSPAFGQVTSTVAAQQRVITVGARVKF